MECKAIGVLDSTTTHENLQERLCCISGEPLLPLKQLEVVLIGPSYTKGITGADLRLVLALEAPGTAQTGATLSSWKVCSLLCSFTLQHRAVCQYKSSDCNSVHNFIQCRGLLAVRHDDVVMMMTASSSYSGEA